MHAFFWWYGIFAHTRHFSIFFWWEPRHLFFNSKKKEKKRKLFVLGIFLLFFLMRNKTFIFRGLITRTNKCSICLWRTRGLFLHRDIWWLRRSSQKYPYQNNKYWHVLFVILIHVKVFYHIKEPMKWFFLNSKNY